jgi:hypothetical protein
MTGNPASTTRAQIAPHLLVNQTLLLLLSAVPMPVLALKVHRA